jgi:RNA polymerase sporulation-specific sigma factor
MREHGMMEEPFFDDSNLCFTYMQDEELVYYAKQGSQRAAEILLKRYRSLVEMKARSYFLIGAEHEDVVQEGLLGLYKAIRDFRYDRFHKFRPFAELCVTRQIISAVKAATRQKHIPLNDSISIDRPIQDRASADADTTLGEMLPDPNALTPEEVILYQRIPMAVLRLAQERMSPLELQVLECYLDGLSYREMSEKLNRHTKCIDNALQRVKKKIVQVYQEYYGEENTAVRRRKRLRIAPELDDNLL